jgi:hypothetical protein
LTPYFGFTTGQFSFNHDEFSLTHTRSFVDSIFWVWQAHNAGSKPELWFNSDNPTDPLPTDPLLPFHKDTNGTLITSNDVKYTSDWGFMYVSGRIQYPPSTVGGALTPADKKYLNRYINYEFGRVTRAEMLKQDEIKGKDHDYIINVIYDRSVSQHLMNEVLYSFFFPLFFSFFGEKNSSFK